MARKIPTDAALGRRPVPRSSGLPDTGRAAAGYLQAADTYSRSAAQSGQGLLELGQSIGEASEEIRQGFERIRMREESLARITARDAFNTEADTELKRVLQDGDLGAIRDNVEYSTYLAKKRQKFLEDHNYSDESRSKLAEMLSPIEHEYAGKAASLGYEAQQKKLDIQLGAAKNNLIAQAYDPSSDIVSIFRSWDATVANFKDVTDASKQRAAILGGREAFAEAKITSFLFRGMSGIDQAESLLQNPRLKEVLGDGAQARIRGRISALQAARAEALLGPVKGIPRDVWDSLPQSKQFEILGPRASAESNMTIEIGDATSPTGTRIIPRSMVGKELTAEDLQKYPPGKPSSGLNLEFDPATGRPTKITTGRQGGDGSDVPGMGKSGSNLVDTDLLNALNTRQSLAAITSRFKPEFQEIPTRLNMKWTALKDKGGGVIGGLSEADKTELTEFTKYRAEAGQLFSNVLKQLSGVAVNPTEFKRAEAYLPSPGTGIFDGDSPTELNAKIQRFTEFNDRAVARLAYTKARGVKFDSVKLDDIPKIIQTRGDEIATLLLQQGIYGSDLREAVKLQLAREFGFVAQ